MGWIIQEERTGLIKIAESDGEKGREKRMTNEEKEGQHRRDLGDEG